MKNSILIIIIAFLLSGCFPSIGKKSDAPTGEFIEGKVIEGFPAIPLYPKAKVIETYGLDASYGGSFISKDKLVDVVNFYNTSFAELGWEATLRQKSETNYVYDVKNSVSYGQVIINTAADGKTTAISVFVEPR